MLVPGAGRIQVAHQGIRSLLRQTLGADLGGSVAPGPAVGDQGRSRCHPVHGLRQLRAADPVMSSSQSAGRAATALDQAAPAALAGYIREQWSIESLHWLRDTPQPRHRRSPPGRPHRYHRSHPIGRTLHGPALHRPWANNMILEWPWARG